MQERFLKTGMPQDALQRCVGILGDEEGHEGTRDAIIDVLAGLPYHIQLYIAETCTFVVLDLGRVLIAKQPPQQKYWILITYSGGDVDTIAHEIAHVWCGHCEVEYASAQCHEDDERDADRLVDIWGLGRPGFDKIGE